MGMTRKHYKAIAEIINKSEKAHLLNYAGSVMQRFIDYFEKDNPEFNRDKFIKACDIYE